MTGTGRTDDPWVLSTPPGTSEYTMYRDDSADPPQLVCQVGSTTLTYDARVVDDLHAWLREQGDWVPLGAADEQKPAKDGHRRGVGRGPESNPVGGWYGLRKGYRGRFGMYLPPLLEALGLAELEHDAAQQPHARQVTRPDARGRASSPRTSSRALLADQLPHLAHLPISRYPSTGTVNAIVRLGEDLYVRLPRVPAWADDLAKELALAARARPVTAPHRPRGGRRRRADRHLPPPVGRLPVGPGRSLRRRQGRGGTRGPGPRRFRHRAPGRAGARGRARRWSPPARGPRRRDPRRPAPLRHLVDADAALAAWDRALEAPTFGGALRDRVWLHGDLLPPNVLVRDGHLEAVLDFGSVGIGDPAADTIAAWTMFTRAGRTAYREALDVDDATWERARGYALTQAALIVPYYERTNRAFSDMARRTIAMVVDSGSVASATC